MADWIITVGDHQSQTFVLIDKQYARMYVFDGDARLLADSAVLVGSAPGDDSVPGIGERAIDEILPAERTTPAGRFLGELGRTLSGEEVVWLDYDAAVSIHRLRPGTPEERRAERLATPDPADNRITYGCVNVPADFYLTVVSPLFATAKTLIYVLPEVESGRETGSHQGAPLAPVQR
jgi:hypothetical protein